MIKDLCIVPGCYNYRLYRKTGQRSNKHCGMHNGRLQYRKDVGPPGKLPSLIKSLKGRRFGKLVPWKLAKRKAANGGVYWICTCDCGKKVEVASTTLLTGRYRKDGCGAHPTKRTMCGRGHNMADFGRTPTGACKLCCRVRRWQTCYGMTEKDYRELWSIQHGKCAICGVILTDMIGQQGFGRGTRVEIDHEHGVANKRLSVRGLLCGGRWSGCNRKLGHFKLEWLKQSVVYLQDPPARRLFK